MLSAVGGCGWCAPEKGTLTQHGNAHYLLQALLPIMPHTCCSGCHVASRNRTLSSARAPNPNACPAATPIHLDGAVEAAARQAPVGRPHQAQRVDEVPLQRQPRRHALAARHRVPQANKRVVASAGQRAAVRRVRHAHDVAGVPCQHGRALPRLYVPQPHVAVVAAAGNLQAIGPEHGAHDPPTVADQHGLAAACRRVPKPAATRRNVHVRMRGGRGGTGPAVQLFLGS